MQTERRKGIVPVVQTGKPCFLKGLGAGSAMTITLRLFSSAREKVGADSMTLELPAGATVAQLRSAAIAAAPALAGAQRATRIAINREFAGDTQVLRDGDEAAWIPPVSGG